MKLTSQFLVIASAVCLMACSQENNNMNTESAAADDISAPSALSAPIDSAATPQDQAPYTVDATATVTEPANEPVAAGMNPPHGQPGHDCAVPVGSPLNAKSGAASSAPVVNATPQTSTSPVASPVFTNPNANAAPTQTVAGTNPPHGAPGHDCAIPVGAPLKK